MIFFINWVIIRPILKILILTLHSSAENKWFCPHCCERHQTKSSSCFDLPCNLSLGFGTYASLQNKDDEGRIPHFYHRFNEQKKLELTLNATCLLLIIIPASVMKFARNLTFCSEKKNDEFRYVPKNVEIARIIVTWINI